MADLKILGELIGVDFTQAGKFTDDSGKEIKYQNSIKLKTSVMVDIEKNDIKTKTNRQVIIKLPTEDIASDVARFNKEIGKNMSVSIVPQDGQVFQVTGEVVFK